MSSDSLEICAPYCLQCVEKCTLVGREATATPTRHGSDCEREADDDGKRSTAMATEKPLLDTQSAISIILVLLQGLTSAQAERVVLPFLVRILQVTFDFNK